MKHLLWLFIIANMSVYGQKIDKTAINKLFPDENVVFLNKNEHLFIDYKAEKWDIRRRIHEKMYFLDAKTAAMYAEKRIYYSGFEDISELEAQTFVPIKKGKKIKYEERKVGNIETKDVMSGNIFYGDMKLKSFVFPAIETDAFTELNYTETLTEPRLLGAFYFGSYAPVLDSKFEVSVPKHIKITYKLLGKNTDNISFEESTQKGITTYKWSIKNIKNIKAPSNAPSSSYYEPHIAIYINKVLDEKSQEETTILGDVANLYQWYSSLVKDINKENDEQLMNIVSDLTNNVNDEKEKVKRIFQWVQSNIKYVAFEDGLGGFIPREAADVCQKKYGDCKDMSSIIVKMLEMANVTAYLTWIGSRDRPYSYKDVPSPIVDNHMIAAVKLDNEYVFLDATGEYLPFGLPTSMIQGKEALIGVSEKEFELVKVPVLPKEKNSRIEKNELTIKDNDLLGKATTTLTGYQKVFAEYDKMNADSDNLPFFDIFLQQGNNKFEVKEVNDEGFFSQNDEIKIDYDFVIPDYVKKVSDKIYINLNIDKKFYHGDIDLEKRELDMEMEYQYLNTYEMDLQIPEGYTVDDLPESSQFENDLYGYKIEYEEKNGKVKYKKELYINFLILEKKHFEDWNKMIAQIKAAYQEVLVLKKQ
ncbi:MAG: DUF3857 domain-containing protein [Chitinophagales bacterium]